MKELNILNSRIPGYVFLILAALIPLISKAAYFFLCDYAIIWDGAWRMAEGQLPYRDFGIPLGIGAFWLPAIVLKFLGPAFANLKVSQFILSVLSAYSVWRISDSMNLAQWKRNFVFLTFLLTYAVYATLPWYNTTAFTFELLAIAALLSASLKKDLPIKWLIGGLCVAVTIFSKQDFGGITLIASAGFVLVSTILFLRKYTNIAYFLTGLILGFAVFILPFPIEDFAYWFNYGQAHHERKSLSLKGVLYSLTLDWSSLRALYLILLSTAFLILWRSGKLLSEKFRVFFLSAWWAIVLVFQSAFTVTISGLEMQHSYHHFLALAVVLMSLFAVKKYRLIILTAILLLFAPAAYKFYSDPFSKSLGTKSTIQSFKSLSLNLESHSYIDSILVLSEHLPDNFKYLNISELTPLNAALGHPPSIGYPLWFHPGTSLFSREESEFVEAIENDEFDLVIFQKVHRTMPKLREALNRNYHLQYKFASPHMMYIKERSQSSLSDNYIYVYRKL